MFDKILFFSAILTNLIMLGFALFIATFEHGSDARLALLLIVPPLLSIIALVQTGGIEERQLRKQVRKAALKKQLKDLEEFLK